LFHKLIRTPQFQARSKPHTGDVNLDVAEV